MKKLLFILLTLPCVLHVYKLSSMNLGDYAKSGQLTAASVLPITTNNPDYRHQPVVLLAREAFGSYAGQYSDFGGQNDINAPHPVVLAAKEFHEETAGVIDEQWARKYIDIDTGNTQAILIKQNKGWVTYLTDVNYAELQKITSNFYHYRNRAPKREYREKEKLAWVAWSDLQHAVTTAQKDHKGDYQASVPALIIDTRRTQAQNSQIIPLTSMFIAKLRSFFENKSYTPGKNPKIRYYAY